MRRVVETGANFIGNSRFLVTGLNLVERLLDSLQVEELISAAVDTAAVNFSSRSVILLELLIRYSLL